MSDAFERYAAELAPSPAEIDLVVAHLDAGPTRAPRAGLRGWAPTLALAAAALLAAALLLPRAESGPRLRGVAGGPPPLATGPAEVRLRLAVATSGGLSSARDGDRYRVGDRAYFQVWATGPTPVALWVEGPSGRHDISRVEVAGRDPVDVEGGRLSWRFDEPGRYHFLASPDGRCDDGCAAVSVEVR